MKIVCTPIDQLAAEIDAHLLATPDDVTRVANLISRMHETLRAHYPRDPGERSRHPVGVLIEVIDEMKGYGLARSEPDPQG